MRKLLLPVVVLISINATSQNNTGYYIIEGGKALVELVRVFKSPKYVTNPQDIVEKKDSCSLKNVCDLSFRNRTDKNLYISLYRRNGNTYEANALSMRVLPKATENLYELRSGIYKFKIEIEGGENEKRIVYREGEMKLVACENVLSEIKF